MLLRRLRFLFHSWRIRKNRAEFQCFQNLGEPVEGWRPTTSSIAQGREEYVGLYENEQAQITYITCATIRNERSEKPRAIRFMADTPIDLSDDSHRRLQEISGVWPIEELEYVNQKFCALNIRWLGPMETFNFLYYPERHLG